MTKYFKSNSWIVGTLKMPPVLAELDIDEMRQHLLRDPSLNLLPYTTIGSWNSVLTHPHGPWMLQLLSFLRPYTPIYGIAARAPSLSPPTWGVVSHLYHSLLEVSVWTRSLRAWLLRTLSCPTHHVVSDTPTLPTHICPYMGLVA